ncbi:IS110 family transposase [Acrocarpospora pleiomorpha]|uniref:IS110 family transposase n=1 Tax=Acrocarpospora pleiomorpha TaxID=90975 RepID=A0A5M3XGW0_9ACTN|nr:IS110 family transposase [Acrocarpospora pleiomorpha]GES20777.1 IS110 family transposase [Acrocarpospora pleiomorpha]
MRSVTGSAGPIHLGMDTSRDAIVVGILRPGEETPIVDRIFNDEPSIRRLVGRFPDPGVLRVCYEAGFGGYALHRLFSSMGVDCQVIAPALVPKGAGERVKTDRRDAIRLARLHRAGELTAIRVPSAAEEAVRDLVRARADLVEDRKRAKQRIVAMLLRQGRVFREGAPWTAAHERWLSAQRFDEPALAATYAHYRAGLPARVAELAAIEAELWPWAHREPLAGSVARLVAYRGIGELIALTLAAEIVDWRRFPTATAFMGFTGLTPSEYSSGTRIARGHITKAGPVGVRTVLIEAAWKYHYQPAIRGDLRKRQAGASPATLARSLAAQHRLCGKFRRMSGPGGKPGTVTVVAVARELAGFIWAEMTSQD